MKSKQKSYIALLMICVPACQMRAQSPSVALPEAPRPRVLSARIAPPAQSPASSLPATSGEAPALLTREQAEQIALANNPRVRISQLVASIQQQSVREVRADELPNLSGSITSVTANTGSRISSGYLTASSLLEHAGAGVQISQLITDFGRSRNLVAAAQLQEKARTADAEASRQEIVLATDQVFYAVMEAQETLQVALQTVAARQDLTDQVSALTSSKLRSELDLSFAQVSLSQAKLLQLDAQNDLDASKAALSAVLGYDSQMNFQLVDDEGPLPPLPADSYTLVAQAIQNRPDLQALRDEELAASKLSKAQREQMLPTISAMGVAGGTPVGSSEYFTTNWYGAVGGNVNIPIFNGFRFSAQASEARLQAQSATERTRLLREQVVRDVRVAWLNANTALQRVTVTAALLKQANSASDLAKTRYDLGLSSVVELSQAELQQTEAAIGNANARSQYNFAISTINFQTGVRP